MTAQVYDIADGGPHVPAIEVERLFAQFQTMPVGSRTVYHTGFWSTRNAAFVAARMADETGIGLLFQRPTGRASGPIREFDWILVRCSRAAAKALRQQR